MPSSPRPARKGRPPSAGAPWAGGPRDADLARLVAIVTGFAGVMLASRMSLGDPKTSVGLELGVISACVLGGVSLTGGVGSMAFVIAVGLNLVSLGLSLLLKHRRGL